MIFLDKTSISMKKEAVGQQTTCYHCGEDCGKQIILADQKKFCCEGCKMVYQILNKGGLCDYYELTKNPGSSRKIAVRKDKFLFLDDNKIQQSLITYKSDTQTHISFYLPQMHCSSCLWLLENLHRLDEHIVTSKVNFSRKEVDIVFNHSKRSLRKVAELLAGIGYEPYISLNDVKKDKPHVDKSKIYKLGVAGFAFINIMLMSFPEYLGIDTKEQSLVNMFRYLNLLLSLPVFFYSASEFYVSAWKSITQKYLNIDAPIVLAVIITFGRSVYDVVTNTGGGYFDSMSGIVFFMLVGRVLQDKTYEQLSFDRDYTSYFPIAVTRLDKHVEVTTSLSDIKLDETLLIHNEELIPADGILTRGTALIDYSFVTGESLPVKKETGEIVYAGGKQIGSNIEILVIKEVAQSYLTKLWNRDELKNTDSKKQHSFVNLIARYFTWIVFGIAAITAIYWSFNDPSKIWNSVTAVMIIACPCALLLSNTFTNGNVLRILGRNKFYLRNATTIESIANANHIVFDKTGTLTSGNYQDIEYVGKPLPLAYKRKLSILTNHSSHPLSKALSSYFGVAVHEEVIRYTEWPGHGIEGIVDGDLVSIGSRKFILNDNEVLDETAVYVAVEEQFYGKFIFRNQYRHNVLMLISQLRKSYSLSLLSGDNAGERQFLSGIFGKHAYVLFHQKPNEKLEVIKQMQAKGDHVIMLGDGINDAGALKQADVGIAVSDNRNNFTPASDAIIEADQLPKLDKFIRLCKVNKRVVVISFVVSVLYNIIGIYFSVQGTLSPMIAAILMPASSLSILLVTFGYSNYLARRIGLD